MKKEKKVCQWHYQLIIKVSRPTFNAINIVNEAINLIINFNRTKGFEMLMKMGYKPGCGVGKNPTGISEPISINIKTNRSGLGKITKPKLTTKINTTNKLDNLNATDFRERMAMKKAQQLIEHDLCTSRKACQQLDTNNNVDSPVQPWYWPIIEKKDSINDEKVDEEKEEEEEAEDNEEETDIPEVPIIEQLNILTDYLRNTYYYCIWCGATYDSLNDLNDNCPGNNRNEH